ncbi:MAG: sugar transferase [Nitrosopumilus sp.]|nr:sugar transferase [Nitrosopumilus sp.]
MNYAPILLFTYKKLEPLKQTIAALQNNFLATDTELFIFSDGPKNENDKPLIDEVRHYLDTIEGFKRISISTSEDNKGLANSIIDGVTLKLQEYEKIIVLEDDLITSKNFLLYMNQALSFYENNLKIYSISGYSIPIKIPINYTFHSYFLPRASSWGWGTWRNRWENIDWDVNDFKTFKFNKQDVSYFNNGGSDMFIMLKKQIEGKLDSWAIRWCYHQFKMNAYSVYPTISKVNNIGFSKMATNTNVYNRYKTPLDNGKIESFCFNSNAELDFYFVNQLRKFFSIRSRALGKLKTYYFKYF